MQTRGQQTSGVQIGRWTFEGPYTGTDQLRDVAAVYAILDRRSDGKWHPIDLGESGQVKSRVETHDRKDCWEQNRQGTLGVAVLYMSVASERRVVEQEIRATYLFPCGDR